MRPLRGALQAFLPARVRLPCCALLAFLCLSATGTAHASGDGCPAPPAREPIEIRYTPELDFSSDQTLIEGTKITLIGNARVNFQNRVVLADRMSYDSEDRSIEVAGAFRVRQDELEIEGRNLHIVNNDRLSGEAVAVYRLAGAGWQVQADRIELDRRGNLRLEGIQATACVEGDRSWSVGIREIVSKADTVYGEARGIRLRIADRTVFLLPYTAFPRRSDRRSGWLFPILGYSSDGGLNLEANYYFNLAPHYDLTLGVGTHTARGASASGEFRYLGRASELELSGYFLSQDAEHDTARAGAEDRWMGVLKYHSRMSEDVSLRVLGQRVSDKRYLRDFSVDLDSETYDRQYLRSEVNLRYSGDTADYQLIYDHYQSLVSGEENWTRPMAVVFGHRYSVGGDWYVDLDGRLEEFRAERYQQAPGHSEIRRRYARVQMGRELHRPHLYLNGYAAMNSLAHDLDGNAASVHGRRNSEQSQAEAALDLRLYLARSLDSGGVIEASPRLYYLYRREADLAQAPRIDSGRVLPSREQIFRSRSWYGYDYLSAHNRLALGVDWSFYSRSSRLLAHLGVAHNRNLENSERYELGDETFLELNLYPGRRSHIYAQVQRGEAGVLRETLGLSVLGSRQRGVQVSWHRVSDAAPEPDAGMEAAIAVFWLPVSSRLSLFSGGSLDLVQERELRMLSGVQYRSCCWTFRLANLQYERVPGQKRSNYVFEFRMHGLGSLGRDLRSAFRRWLPWIDERD